MAGVRAMAETVPIAVGLVGPGAVGRALLEQLRVEVRATECPGVLTAPLLRVPPMLCPAGVACRPTSLVPSSTIQYTRVCTWLVHWLCTAKRAVCLAVPGSLPPLRIRRS